jgi:uncharacterized protein YgbK (DUF1537 family)
LGLGLARALVETGRVRPSRAEEEAALGPPVGGPAVCLAGSCSQATLGQIAEAEKAMPVLRLLLHDLDHVSEAVSRLLLQAAERMAQGPVLIASSAPPAEIAAAQARHGREAVGHAIEQAFAAIAEGLVARGLRRLVVAGGETSGAVVDRLGIAAFLVGPEIAPGVPVLRKAGGPGGDMVLALKSGNFGGARFFSDALALMR